MMVRCCARLVAAVPALGSLIVLAWVLLLTRRGLGILDESYLLRLIEDPQGTRSVGEVYLFGFLLHPVFEAVGRDVAAFRVAGIVGLVGTGWLLAAEGIAQVRREGVVVARGTAALVKLVIMASTVLVLSFNVMIPAYRWVAFIGAAIAVVGVGRLGRGLWLSGGFLVGVGGWLCFVGKPTSAAALLVVTAAVLVQQRLVQPRSVGAAACGLVFAVTATLACARMTPVEAVSYLSQGAELESAFGAHPGWLVVLGLNDHSPLAGAVFAPMLLLPVALAIILRGRVRPQRRGLVDAIATVAICATALLVAVVSASDLGPLGTGWQMMSVVLVLPAVTVALMLLRAECRRRTGAGASAMAFVVLLLCVPYATAVGSNLPFAAMMPVAGSFWALALLVVVLRRGVMKPSAAQEVATSPSPSVATSHLVMTFVVATVAVATFVAQSTLPERGVGADELVSASVAGGRLRLLPQDAHAAEVLGRASRTFGLRDVPVVDLSGMGAGYAVMTDGRPLGRAHMYGYLPHSIDAATMALDRESCSDLARAWVLYSPGNGSDISPAFTRNLLDLDRDYRAVTEFGFVNNGQSRSMQLLRPTKSVSAKLGC